MGREQQLWVQRVDHGVANALEWQLRVVRHVRLLLEFNVLGGRGDVPPAVEQSVKSSSPKRLRTRGNGDSVFERLRDCRPSGDDAGTGAALNPRKLKRAARRACCFCALRLRLKRAWSNALGTKKTPSWCLGLSGVGGPKRTSVCLKLNFHF